MRRTLITTEKCLREILKSPSSIWYLIINKQDNIVISTNADNNKFEHDCLMQRLENKQIKILPESDIVNQLPTNPTFLEDLSDCLFLLEIPKTKADELSRDFGICCFSSENYDNPYVTNAGWDINTGDNDPSIIKSWDYFYQGVNRNCTSAIIIDRYLFSTEWNKEKKCPNDTIDDCKYNLQCIMDNVIPFEIKNNKFVLTIIFNCDVANKETMRDNKGKILKDEKEHIQYSYYTFNELVDIIEDVRKEIIRPFQYDIEVLSVNQKCKNYSDTHDRYIITNFHITTATHKLVTFTPNKQFLYKQRLIFDYIYSKGLTDKSSLPLVTKESVLRAMRNLLQKEGNSLKYSLNGTIQDFKHDIIRNKLLRKK